MSDTAPGTIKLRTDGNDYQQEYALNGAAIRPGMLLALNSSSKVIPNGTAADATPECIVALEMDLLGRTIDDNYVTADEAVISWFPRIGDEAYMLLKTGNNAAVNALLESAGAGNLQLVSTGKALFRAVEAVNNASGVDARIRVRRVA